MKSTAKHVLSFITIVIFIMLAIASSPSKRSMTVAKKQIPPDFKGYNGTLLIESQSKSWNKYMEKYFSKNYTGKYSIIKNVDDPAYADKTAYRFVIDRSLNTATEFSHGTSSNYTSSANICILDRVTGFKYCTRSASKYSALIKKYAQALEEERTR